MMRDVYKRSLQGKLFEFWRQQMVNKKSNDIGKGANGK